MYKIPKRKKIGMYTIEPYEGETIESKIRRVVDNKEPITDGAPIIYTEKKDGVRPEYDVRTDRWDVALNAMEKVNGSKIAKSKEYMKPKEDEAKPDKPNKPDKPEVTA